MRWTRAAGKLSRIAAKAGFRKSVVYRGLVGLRAPAYASAVRFLESRSPFLITSTGRTATKWLAALLDGAAGACVAHEPVPDEQHALFEALRTPPSAEKYLRSFRLRDMALRARDGRARVYGEVNSALRFHVQALQNLMPGMRMIHLVRDGRDVVRSVLTKRARGQELLYYHSLRPPELDSWTARWDELSEFEQVCWGWQFENAWLRRHIPLYVRFEDILTSFDAFEKGVLEPLGLSIERSAWERSAERPRNTSETFSIPHWSAWPPEMAQQFRAICEPEMQAYGYALPRDQQM